MAHINDIKKEDLHLAALKIKMEYQAASIHNCLNCKYSKISPHSDGTDFCELNPAFHFPTREKATCKFWKEK